ncbi:MAG: hypothetical protein H6581_26520 [Bacteroidia bacterium]|nr:hypothetical protein [Bacteroidia bacterium]
MSRFNLLLINPDVQAGHTIVKAIYKVFKRNFVFEVESATEASRLLEKIKIDLIIVDFDNYNGEISQVIKRNPRVPVIGMYSKMNVHLEFDPDRIQLFSKIDLMTDLVLELKSLKKSMNPPAAPARYGAPSFRDYFKLAAIN